MTLTIPACRKCGLLKKGYVRPSTGRTEWKCLPCINEYMKNLYHTSEGRRVSVANTRKRRRSDPAKRALETQQFRAAHLARKFGISVEDYERLLLGQKGMCAICSTTDPGGRGGKYFAVDHCHVTKQVRGLLCFDCNTGIGKLGDTAALLMRAVKYLESHEIA